MRAGEEGKKKEGTREGDKIWKEDGVARAEVANFYRINQSNFSIIVIDFLQTSLTGNIFTIKRPSSIISHRRSGRNSGDLVLHLAAGELTGGAWRRLASAHRKQSNKARDRQLNPSLSPRR